MTVKKGDQVQIIAGKERGKKGTVEKVLPLTEKVVVSGLHLRKRHLKPSKSAPKGGILELPSAVYRSKVMIICPHCSKPTRVTHQIGNDIKFRACVHCKASLDTK